MDIPRVIAHRGSPKAAPENTLASFRQAAHEGARWVEFDVALTQDARPVIFHDAALDRTTDGEGLLCETPFELLTALDAGVWFAPKFAGEMVPTLEEALELFLTLGLGFNMEIKPDPGRETALSKVAMTVARGIWPATAPTPLISSFSRAAVAAAKDALPAWPRGLIFDRLPEDWVDVARSLGLTTLNANHKNMTAEQVKTVRAAGYKLLTYTVNEPVRAAELFSWGVDAIFTDVPGEMLKAFP